MGAHAACLIARRVGCACGAARNGIEFDGPDFIRRQTCFFQKPQQPGKLPPCIAVEISADCCIDYLKPQPDPGLGPAAGIFIVSLGILLPVQKIVGRKKSSGIALLTV